MKRMRMLAVVALALVICLPGMAAALTSDGIGFGDVTFWGYENGYNSIANTYTQFDTIEMFFTLPTVLTSPTEYGFSPATWNSAVINPQYSKAWGPTVIPSNVLWFNLVMPDPSSVCDYLVWYGGVGGTLVVAQHMTNPGFNPTTFAGDGYHAYGTGDQYNRVPLPPAVLLLGSGLLGLVGLGWRRARKES